LSLIATSAPDLAKAALMAAPSPVAAPVTKAVFPAKLNGRSCNNVSFPA
jgi:hypothetical protein